MDSKLSIVRKVYRAGDIIKGYVSISTPEPLSGCSLKVFITGEASTDMFMYELFERQELLKETVLSMTNASFPEGESKYPFEYRFDPNADLPSSSRNGLGSANLDIKYTVRVKIRCGDEDRRGKLYFVYRGLAFQGKPVTKRAVGDVIRLKEIQLGFLVLSLELPSDQAFMEDNLGFSLTIDARECKVDIVGFDAEIVETIYGYAEGGSLDSRTFSEDRYFEFLVLSGSKVTMNENLKIPKMPHSTTYTNPVQIRHSLTIKPKFKIKDTSGPSVMSHIKINYPPTDG